MTTLFIATLMILLAAFSYYFIAFQELQKKYKVILAEQNTSTNTSVSLENPAVFTKANTSGRLKDAMIQNLMDGIDKLEDEKAFLQPDFGLAYIAKALQSNTSYISKVINTHKQCTFKEYVNKLRIEYISNQLKEDPMLLKYSIHHIACSIGYADACSFSKIFKRHMGITPSHYIKQIRQSPNR